MFDIKNTNSFNTDRLVFGTEYDYVTRTSFNQGVLQKTGYISKENINEPGVWSLGLLQMDFFYRTNPWYAGQFVRKIIPKIYIPNNTILFFTVILNKLKRKLLSVLVRNVDKEFENTIIKLPVKDNNIDFDFMATFISELEEERISELEAYLQITGLDNYELTEEENNALKEYENLPFKEYNIIDIFDVKNTKSILSRDIKENSGSDPYLCSSSENNSVASYITYNETLKDRGNCIFIGGKTFVVSYQEKDFYSNDSHNLALYMKQYKAGRYNQLYLSTCVEKSLSYKYFWGDSVSKSKIKKDLISLPIKNQKVDYENMDILISAISKLVIKDVVLYKNKKIELTKKIVDKR